METTEKLLTIKMPFTVQIAGIYLVYCPLTGTPWGLFLTGSESCQPSKRWWRRRPSCWRRARRPCKWNGRSWASSRCWSRTGSGFGTSPETLISGCSGCSCSSPARSPISSVSLSTTSTWSRARPGAAEAILTPTPIPLSSVFRIKFSAFDVVLIVVFLGDWFRDHPRQEHSGETPPG